MRAEAVAILALAVLAACGGCGPPAGLCDATARRPVAVRTLLWYEWVVADVCDPAASAAARSVVRECFARGGRPVKDAGEPWRCAERVR